MFSDDCKQATVAWVGPSVPEVGECSQLRRAEGVDAGELIARSFCVGTDTGQLRVVAPSREVKGSWVRALQELVAGR